MKASDVSICISRTLPPVCPPGSPNVRLALVVLSIGAASHFLLFLDSVVDNLLPAAMPFLLKAYRTKEDADLAWELLVSSRMYGLAFGCFLSIVLSNSKGRKFQVVFGALLDIIGVLFTLLVVYLPNGMGVPAAIVGRLINGVGNGIVQTAGSVMLAELPPIRKRGTALATLTMWACLGELGGMFISLEEFLGRPSVWHWAMAIPLIPLIPAFFILLKAPESPRYLFMENRENEARKAMLYYQSPTDGQQSLEEIFSEMRFLNEDENGNPRKRFGPRINTLQDTMQRLRDGHFVRPLLIGLFVQSFVHLDDWLWISYSTQIFENHGLPTAGAQRASLYMSLPQAAISIILLLVFDNFPRRLLLIAPTIASAGIGIAAIYWIVFSKAVPFGIPTGLALPILASFDLSTAAVCGESAYAIVPELFLPNDKILGTAFVGIVQNVFGGVLTTFLLSALNHMGTAVVLVPFVVMNIVYVIVNWRYVPETAGRTSQEIAMNFSREVPGITFFDSLTAFTKLHFSEYVPSRLFTLNNLLNVLVFAGQVAICVFIMHIVFLFFQF